MPLTKYYGGHGTEVMANMKKTYGPKKAKQVFYATANKHKINTAPSEPVQQKALQGKK